MSFRWKIAQFFEGVWWRVYLSNKSPERYIAWKKNYWVNILQRFDIAVSDEMRVLDAGCGPAGIFLALSHCKVTAIDPLLSQYQNLPHFDHSNTKKLAFIESNLEEFVSSEPFDIVFCLNVINHVDDIKQSLTRLHQALVHGGRMYLSVDAHKWRIGKSILQRLPADILHPHQFDVSGYYRLLENSGFKPLSTTLIDRGLVFNYWMIIAEKHEKV